jgi:hypothetical protein
MAHDHYLPAGLIGGFGLPTSRRRRESRIAAWFRGAPHPVPTTAENVAHANKLYTLENPPVGVPADAVDNVWRGLEAALPDAVERLTQNQSRVGDEDILYGYVASTAVRHPTLDKLADLHGLEIHGKDHLQVVRLDMLLNTLTYVRSLRWRVLISPPEADRFLLSDNGFIYVSQGTDWPSHGIVVPVAPRTALLGFMYHPERQRQAPNGFLERLHLVPSWVRFLNAATRHTAPYVTIGHPDDVAMMESLEPPIEVRVNQHGPYRSGVHELFEDVG